MKKLMVTLSAVAFAASLQAAQFNWDSDNAPQGLVPTTLDGNGVYAAGGDLLNGNSALNYSLQIFAADGTTKIGTAATGSVDYDFMFDSFSVYNINIADAAIVATTSYKYELTLTGTLDSLAAYKDDKWDYTATTVETVLTGGFDGMTGINTITSGIPSTWTVSGAVAVPEPTSGLLLLLGVAGLALRRRRA